MPIDEWKVGQEVVVHYTHANQGSPTHKSAIISKIGRKYILLKGMDLKFDASWEVPRANRGEELYTPLGYIEMLYIRKVLRTFEQFRGTKWPIELMLQLGDHLLIDRPSHLRDDLSPELAKALKEPIT